MDEHAITVLAFLFVVVFFSPSKDKNEAVCIKKKKNGETHTQTNTKE